MKHLIVFLLSVLLLQDFAKAAEDKPNIIFILADDLGWGDLGCYGHPFTKTPNIDALAARGTLYENFYVNGSVCSPSRCAFFTGQYPARHRIHGHYSTPQENEARGMSNWLETKVPNMATSLKSAGYSTAHIGKWHLSGGPPIDQYGFDYVGSGEKVGADEPAADPYYRAKSTQHYVNEAIQFIDQHKSSPFFVQLWTLMPHAILNPTPEQMKPYAYLRAGGKGFPHAAAAEIFSASMTDLDTQLGRLFKALEERQLTQKTLIILSSDNGPEDIHVGNAGHSGVGSAGPFRGRKRSLYEGGVRVPGIVSWPGHVPVGRIDKDAILAGVDLLPSVCSLAGVKLPADHALDGEDMSDVWLGKERQRMKPLMWQWRFRIFGEPFHHSPELAIREGQWKLLMNPDHSRVELYDLSNDLTELNNVAEHHADIVERLSKQVREWSSTLPAGPHDPGAGQMNIPMPGQKQTAAAKRKSK